MAEQIKDHPTGEIGQIFEPHPTKWYCFAGSIKHDSTAIGCLLALKNNRYVRQVIGGLVDDQGWRSVGGGDERDLPWTPAMAQVGIAGKKQDVGAQGQ